MVPGRDDHRAEVLTPDVPEAGFRQLVAFRHHIRQFLHRDELPVSGPALCKSPRGVKYHGGRDRKRLA